MTNTIASISNTVSGSTIIQLDSDGNVSFSILNSFLSNTKDEIKDIPGSIESISQNEIIVGCSKDKMAKIFNTTNKNVIWQYESDRYITSAKIKRQNKIITILDNYIENATMYVSIGSTITFRNYSSIPIKIYSGKTTFEDFYLDADLSLYGGVFQSPLLQPLEEWELEINIDKSSDWFVYPTIDTGKLIVQNQQVISDDTFIIFENDGKKVPFSSRIIELDYDGNILWSFGEAYLSNPRRVQVLSNGLLLNT